MAVNAVRFVARLSVPWIQMQFLDTNNNSGLQNSSDSPTEDRWDTEHFPTVRSHAFPSLYSTVAPSSGNRSLSPSHGHTDVSCAAYNWKQKFLNEANILLLRRCIEFLQLHGSGSAVKVEAFQRILTPIVPNPYRRSLLARELYSHMLSISGKKRSNRNFIHFLDLMDYVFFKRKVLLHLFELADSDGDGKLLLADARHALTRAGLYHELVEGVIQLFERNGIQKISYAQWEECLMFLPLHASGEPFEIWQSREGFMDVGDIIPFEAVMTATDEGEGVLTWEELELTRPSEHFQMIAKRILHSAAFLHLSSGAVAGAVSRTATAPLDRIKTVMQVTSGSNKITIRCTISRILREGNGLLSFFRGNGTNCLKIAPESAVKFFSYDLFKRRIIMYKKKRQPVQMDGSAVSSRHESPIAEGLPMPPLLRTPSSQAASASLNALAAPPIQASSSKLFNDTLTSTVTHGKVLTNEEVKLNFFEKLFCGGSAGICAQLMIYPMEVVKTRLSLCPTGVYRGIIHCLCKTYKTEGLFALYRGLRPSLLGIIPYAGIDLACFETFKSMWCAYHEYDLMGNEPSVYVLLGCGALSSSLGQIASYPISLIRTRMQADGMNNRPKLYHSATHVFTKIITEEGVRTLYRGLGPNLMKTVPAVSISWAVYETWKKQTRKIVDTL